MDNSTSGLSAITEQGDLGLGVSPVTESEAAIVKNNDEQKNKDKD